MVFDPLDGSSNIDAGISVGSIFGIYAPAEDCKVGVNPQPFPARPGSPAAAAAPAWYTIACVHLRCMQLQAPWPPGKPMRASSCRASAWRAQDMQGVRRR